jgi:hypothetical protein
VEVIVGRIHGKNANFSFNAVAIEDELSEITQTITVPESEITSFTDAWQNFLAGKKDVVTEISGSYDASAGQGDITLFSAIGGGVVTTVFDPSGSGPDTNDPEYLCTASGLTGVLVKRYHISLPAGEKAGYSATLQHSGATTRATA